MRWSTFSAEVAGQVRQQGEEGGGAEDGGADAGGCVRGACKGTIDFLKVDVEGMEKRVLMGADFGRFRPRVVLVETAGGSAQGMGKGILTGAGYVFALFDGISRFYARGEEPGLVERMRAWQVNCTDDYVPWRYVVRERAAEKERDVGKITEMAGRPAMSGQKRRPGA